MSESESAGMAWSHMEASPHLPHCLLEQGKQSGKTQREPKEQTTGTFPLRCSPGMDNTQGHSQNDASSPSPSEEQLLRETVRSLSMEKRAETAQESLGNNPAP